MDLIECVQVGACASDSECKNDRSGPLAATRKSPCECCSCCTAGDVCSRQLRVCCRLGSSLRVPEHCGCRLVRVAARMVALSPPLVFVRFPRQHTCDRIAYIDRISCRCEASPPGGVVDICCPSRPACEGCHRPSPSFSADLKHTLEAHARRMKSFADEFVRSVDAFRLPSRSTEIRSSGSARRDAEAASQRVSSRPSFPHRRTVTSEQLGAHTRFVRMLRLYFETCAPSTPRE